MSFLQNLKRRPAPDTETFSLPEGAADLVSSPDATRLAYLVPDRTGVRLEVSGRRVASYDGISAITFSPDSFSLAFIARSKQSYSVVFNGNEGEFWDEIGAGGPVISQDSQRIAYTARRGKRWFAVMDENVFGGPYDSFKEGGIVFSPDSDRVIYAVCSGGEEYTVEDGIQRNSYPAIISRSWTFTPDSSRVAYMAGIRGEWNGDAFIGETAVILDGRVGETWPWDDTLHTDNTLGELYFSPDSQRLAYAAARDGKRFFVVDGVQQKQYDALLAGWKGNPLWKIRPQYGNASCRSEMIVFSPDSQHFAYAAGDARRNLLVFDGEERARHTAFLPRPLLFSPDGQRLAYGVEDMERQLLVVDRSILASPHQMPLLEFSFSPDSSTVALMASSGVLYSCAAGSHSWSRRGVPAPGASLVWDSAAQFHTLIMQGREVIVARFDVD